VRCPRPAGMHQGGNELLDRDDLPARRVSGPGRFQIPRRPVSFGHPPDERCRGEHDDRPDDDMRPQFGLGRTVVDAAGHPLAAYEALFLDVDVPCGPARGIGLYLEACPGFEAIGSPDGEQLALVAVIGLLVPAQFLAAHAWFPQTAQPRRHFEHWQVPGSWFSASQRANISR